MDPYQELVEIEKIKRLRAKYWRCLDTKNWDGFASVFTEDCTLTVDIAVGTFGGDPKTMPAIAGRNTIRDMVKKLVGDCLTVHTGRSPEIDILSETEARAIWQQEEYNDWKHRSSHGHGHYHDTYRKVDGEWLIASVHLKRLRLVDIHRNRIAT
jgi:uncharacterized protein (TIGR02246 family)